MYSSNRVNIKLSINGLILGSSVQIIRVESGVADLLILKSVV